MQNMCNQSVVVLWHYTIVVTPELKTIKRNQTLKQLKKNKKLRKTLRKSQPNFFKKIDTWAKKWFSY